MVLLKYRRRHLWLFSSLMIKMKIQKNIVIFLPAVTLVLVGLFTVYIILSSCLYARPEEPEHETSSADTVQAAQPVSSEAVSSDDNTSSSGLDASFSKLMLVNAQNPLPEGYAVPELAEIPEQYLNGELKQISKEVLPFLLAMIEAASKDGVNLLIRSPYRSYDIQTTLFNNQVQKEINKGYSRQQAEINAATVVARPGTSEHQTGLAVDINSTTSTFENTAEFRWMKEHCAEFGFIMRYPENKTQITGIIYEPWHYRFVGINTAKEITSLGICLEEYLNTKGE